MQTKQRKNIFRYLPMDLGRAVCAASPFYYRHRKLHVSGKKYRGRIKGGMIVVSNHVDFGDPFVLGTCFWYRRMFFLTAKEVMKNRVLEALLKGIGCIKIDREISDIDAIRKSVAVLKEGKCLAVFPQGGLHRDGEIDQIKSGAILIAMQAGVPILPIYSNKRQHWWQRRRIVIGDPFDCREYCNKKFPAVADISHLSELLLEKMEACERTYEQTA